MRRRRCTRRVRTDESLERDGRPDERRIGRLEAVALHATLPLSDVVANWGELAEALGGSVFEDMLA